MLYLEDYLEMIEQLHHDLRYQFQFMHDLDSTVHQETGEVQQEISVFCEKAKQMTKEEWEIEQQPILNTFKRIMEIADEKVSLSTQLHASVSRYLQKLEKELGKFKAELEADSEGITDVLEQMAMKEPEPPDSPKPLKKKSTTTYDANSFDNFSDYEVEGAGTGLEGLDDYRMLYEDINNETNSPQSVVSDLSTDLMHYVRKRKRDHDTASTSNSLPITPTTEIASMNTTIKTQNLNHPPIKRKRPAMFGPGSGNPCPPEGLAQTINGNQLRLNKKLEYQSSQEVFEVDWQYVDPNEPRYCICNQVSYGDMVGCDNPSCPIEWFHYPCVELSDAPKGKWYCPQCREESLKRKK